LIKRKLIANKTEELFYPFLTQVKSSYPIVPIQTYPKIAMSSTSSLGLLVPTNIGKFTEVGGVLTLQPSRGLFLFAFIFSFPIISA